MENVLGLNILGAAIKHLVPTPKINRWIPLINLGAAFGLRMTQTGDVASAGVGALQDMLMATGAHKTAQQVPRLKRI